MKSQDCDVQPGPQRPTEPGNDERGSNPYTGVDSARERRIHQFEPLAYLVANRYLGRGRESEDLYQVAMLGLVKAVDRFKPETHYHFSTFAIPTIEGEIKHYLRDQSHVL